MEEIIGSSNRVLEINLSTETVQAFSVTAADRKLYLGGKGLGLKYLYERIEPGIDPLGQKNILAFMMGVLMGTGAPCSGRFAALTKSPRYINANSFTADLYRNFGTNTNVNYCNKSGIMPIENFRRGRHEQAVAVSGESMRRKYNTKPSTCQPCNILCGHKGTYQDGSVHQIPEFEMISLVGTNLGVKPSGKILLKPNVVIAHPEVFPHAFTRKEFLDGVIRAVKDRAEDVKEIAVGERSGITVPTRYNFKNAGYPGIIKNYKLKTYYFDEVRQVPFKLNRKKNLRRTIFIPQPLTECDFLINLPKFKAHPWCRLTLSLKNFIGLQDDRYRLVDHNQFLEHKIADLQEVIQPQFIAIDGIIAGQKMMLTPTPFQLGAIVMGTNACAVDTVGCHMVHVDPNDLVHLRLASERGFGPLNLEDIEVSGDYPLTDVRQKTINLAFCLQRIDDYFGPDSNLTCTVGAFPAKHSPGYCWGGCPGALQETMHIIRGFYPNVDKEMGKFVM
ncbi:DUF362 domain-containing protein [Thermodesulfobacteriota bacterium]